MAKGVRSSSSKGLRSYRYSRTVKGGISRDVPPKNNNIGASIGGRVGNKNPGGREVEPWVNTEQYSDNGQLMMERSPLK